MPGTGDILISDIFQMGFNESLYSASPKRFSVLCSNACDRVLVFTVVGKGVVKNEPSSGRGPRYDFLWGRKTSDILGWKPKTGPMSARLRTLPSRRRRAARHPTMPRAGPTTDRDLALNARTSEIEKPRSGPKPQLSRSFFPTDYIPSGH